MDYKVVITKDAEEDLERFVQYLVFEKENTRAAQNVLDVLIARPAPPRAAAAARHPKANKNKNRLCKRITDFLSANQTFLYFEGLTLKFFLK